jgi:hypothetical protein
MVPPVKKGVRNMNKVYLGMIMILVCAVACLGQMGKTQKTAPLADEPRKSGRVMLASGTSIDAELQKTVDVNNAKVGDQVVLKTTKSIKQSGEVVVPKGSTLFGRITEVQRRTRENGRSKIGMVFDRIQGRELSMPLTATLVSITGARATAAADDSVMSDVSGSSQTSASTSRSSSGGGLLGGVGNTVGGLVNTTTQTVGTVANTAQGTVGRTLNGIQISTSASGSANSATTLSTPNKNLRVEKGATFHLRVASGGPETE